VAERLLFALLTALLVTEIGWMAGYTLSGMTLAVPVGTVSGVAAAALFYVTAGRRHP
jgi:hypothetical protein